MKKRLCFALAGALLASCGTTSSSSSPLSSEEPVKDPEETFHSLLSTLKETASYEAALSFTIVGAEGQEQKTSYGIQQQFGHDALLWLDEEGKIAPNGALISGEQGVFNYTLSDTGNVELGSFVALDGGLDIEALYDAPTSFAVPSFWKETEEPTVFRTNNEYMQETLAALSGIGAVSAQNHIQFTYGSIYAQVEEERLSFRMEGFLGAEIPVIRGEVVLTGIGTTVNESVASYLENPVKVAAPSAWNDEQKAAIQKRFGGEKAIPLPFPTGASYTLTLTDLEEHEEVMISDVVSGDLTASYRKQLEGEGFTSSFNESTKGWLGRKEVAEGNVHHVYLVHYLYLSQEDIAGAYGEETSKLYPHGRFQIEAFYQSINLYTLEEANAYLSAHSSYAFPLPEYVGVSTVQLEDMSDVNPLIDTAIVFLYQVDTMENAKANLLSYASALEAQGFVEKPTSDSFSLVYVLEAANAQVSLGISRDEKGNYAGSIEAFYLIQAA